MTTSTALDSVMPNILAWWEREFSTPVLYSVFAWKPSSASNEPPRSAAMEFTRPKWSYL